MQVVRTVKELKEIVSLVKNDGRRVGFVPTMGALHEGHLSLVKDAFKDSDFVVVSIFVNPTQFNDKSDLDQYPRDIDRDIQLLESVGCNLLFNPSVNEVYPETDLRIFDFGQLASVMEGEFRPGHFNGVGQVVSKLFDMVKPDVAFFGKKDFQQLAIIREMTRQYKYNVKIVGCPTIREGDGLAMSSRNQLLLPELRKIAPEIAKTLDDSCNFVAQKSIKEVVGWVIAQLNGTGLLEVEYFDIVDGDSLQTVDDWENSDYIIGCIAVFAGKVRLIDNIEYKNLRYEC